MNRGANHALLVAVGGLFLLFLLGCNYERMYDQESIHTYKTAIPDMPEGTVPTMGGIQQLKTADPKAIKNPLVSNSDSLKQGEDAYKYFCIHCHGPQADGKAP
jgi:hypothetical protein